MAYITRIQVGQCRNVRQLDIDLTVPPREGEGAPESSEQVRRSFRHLILTGPNGSGKSGVLKAIAWCITRHLLTRGDRLELGLERFIGQRIPQGHPQRPMADVEQTTGGPTELDDEDFFGVRLHWKDVGPPETRLVTDGDLVPENPGLAIIAAYLPAQRLLHQQRVQGPARLVLEKTDLRPGHGLAPRFLWFLVNKHTEMTYAKADEDTAHADRISAWFDKLWGHIRRFVQDPGLDIRYDRQSFNFKFKRNDGYEFDLDTLADGHAAVLALIGEVLMRIDAVQKERNDYSFDPAGVVIVDEIETHLHLSLQEQILPLLTDMFPCLQFIVATHSPAVIASIPGAIVYDLGKNARALSEDYRGIPYGMLMTDHFGISSDIDLDSTEKLLQLRKLATQPSLTPEEQSKLDGLAAELSARSQVLATEVWMIKEHLSTSNVQIAGE